MPFELEDASPTDFEELMACMWDSYEQPPQDLFRVWCPILSSGPGARKDSLRESTERLLDWHQSDPDSHWQKVVDNQTGKIVAGALWKIYRRGNPFEHPESNEAYWYPEGPQRDFATQILEQFDAPRQRLARRPHLYLNIIFTHPSHRRRGAAGLMLGWGLQKAAELDLEIWLDGWKYGVPVYEKYGFATAVENEIQPQMEEPDEAWDEIARRLKDLKTWVMWRPSNGPVVEGKTPLPWLE